MVREFTREQREKWLRSLHRIPASATVAIENPSGQLLIVKATYKKYWTMPGGVIDEGESPKQAALREVAEEVGLTLDPAAVRFMGATYRTSDVIDTYQFIFGTQISDQMAEMIVLQADEIEQYAFVAKEQIDDGGRLYAPVIKRWADGNIASYDEETIDILTH